MNIDKIYVINLKRRNDRLLKIDKLLKNLGGIFANYETIEAVDGNTLSVQDNDYLTLKSKYLYNNPSLFMDISTKGALGCYLSHLKIWEDAIKNDYNNIIIFEDDVKTNLTLNEIMEYINNVPKDYDIAYLDYYGSYTDNIKVNNYWNKNKLDMITSTSGYILSKKGIQQLLTKAYTIEMQIDFFLSIFTIKKNFNRYLATNKIFEQGVIGMLGFDTDISNFNCIKCLFNELILTEIFCKIFIILLILFFLITYNRK
jgi:GR25 family glycosyltransferase involved in LPS biosynthesis